MAKSNFFNIEDSTNQEEKSTEQFMRELKIDGRFFVGNPMRVDYIARHKKEIQDYILTLSSKNPGEAEQLSELVKINSKPQRVRRISLEENLSISKVIFNGSKSNKNSSSQNSPSVYSSNLRRTAEKWIYLALLSGLIASSIYTGKKYAEGISRLIEPYVNRFDKLMYEIDHGR